MTVKSGLRTNGHGDQGQGSLCCPGVYTQFSHACPSVRSETWAEASWGPGGRGAVVGVLPDLTHPHPLMGHLDALRALKCSQGKHVRKRGG